MADDTSPVYMRQKAVEAYLELLPKDAALDAGIALDALISELKDEGRRRAQAHYEWGLANRRVSLHRAALNESGEKQ